MRRAIAGTGAALVLVASAVAGAAVPTKQNNPCKLVKRGEIAEVLGQDVAAPRKGLSTGVISVCEWEVSPGGTFPDGTISIFIQRVGAKIAYDTNSQDPDYEDVDEFPKAYYDPATGALTILKGKRLLNVQAVFIATEGGIHSVDRKAEVIELAEIALDRF